MKRFTTDLHYFQSHRRQQQGVQTHGDAAEFVADLSSGDREMVKKLEPNRTRNWNQKLKPNRKNRTKPPSLILSNL
ncbi:hypothetical protein L596_006350 [Steinernema carpocapsae]|uniref:Uncharacterized protein n=1 Tax=Steinernema carpocapsae TaxID=34508 RepID=A0A4U8V3V6_STECR|nr:hypothetical protein L596_006350 [Steinernema carpocapsae]